MKQVIIFISLFLTLTGCAGKFEYTPPSAPTKPVNHTIAVDTSRSEVWKKIIPALGSSFFVVNNLEKDSGFINISYSGDPEKYVNCGNINTQVSNMAGDRKYNFSASKAYMEYEAFVKNDLISYKRKMSLEGRINIVVQEISSNETLISINTKYILTRDLTARNTSGARQHANDTISFGTNGSDTFTNNGTVCYATGKLEEEILSSLGLE